jgi:hypothetical protein
MLRHESVEAQRVTPPEERAAVQQIALALALLGRPGSFSLFLRHQAGMGHSLQGDFDADTAACL